MLHYLSDSMFTLIDIAPLHTVAEQSVRIVTPLSEVDPFIAMAVKNLTIGIDSVRKSLQRTRDSKYTRELSLRDKDRDDLSVAFRDHCKSAVKQAILNEAKAKAAGYIVEVYSRHGNSMHRLSNSEQSLRLNAMISELSQIPDVVEAAGATAILKALVDSQKAYEAVHEQRTEERASKEYPLLVEGREKLVYWLDAIYSYIDALMTNDPASHAALVKELQALLTEAMTAARMQQTRDENRQEDQPPAPAIKGEIKA
jgi:hypothetical protein